MVSYLYNRYQYVQFDNQRSNLPPVTHGVFQGSILRPILFNIYVANMSLNIPSLQYADDTNTC